MKKEYIPEKPLYLCDPEKNTSCKKTSCKYNPNAKWQDCTNTTDKEFAMLDEHGEPIKAPLIYFE